MPNMTPYTGQMAYSTAAPAVGIPRFTNKRSKRGQFFDLANNDLIPQIEQRTGRSDTLNAAADSALLDPEGQAERYQGIYQQAANAFAAPAMRDFKDQQDQRSANVASRFGGNVSGEEIRQTNQANDVFSRNLTEALAALAPQAAQQGQNYTGQLQDAAGAATGQGDVLRNQLLQGILGAPNKKKKKGLLSGVGNFLGQVAPAAIAAL